MQKRRNTCDDDETQLPPLRHGLSLQHQHGSREQFVRQDHLHASNQVRLWNSGPVPLEPQQQHPSSSFYPNLEQNQSSTVPSQRFESVGGHHVLGMGHGRDACTLQLLPPLLEHHIPENTIMHQQRSSGHSTLQLPSTSMTFIQKGNTTSQKRKYSPTCGMEGEEYMNAVPCNETYDHTLQHAQSQIVVMEPSIELDLGPQINVQNIFPSAFTQSERRNTRYQPDHAFISSSSIRRPNAFSQGFMHAFGDSNNSSFASFGINNDHRQVKSELHQLNESKDSQNLTSSEANTETPASFKPLEISSMQSPLHVHALGRNSTPFIRDSPLLIHHEDSYGSVPSISSIPTSRQALIFSSNSSSKPLQSTKNCLHPSSTKIQSFPKQQHYDPISPNNVPKSAALLLLQEELYSQTASSQERVMGNQTSSSRASIDSNVISENTPSHHSHPPVIPTGISSSNNNTSHWNDHNFRVSFQQEKSSISQHQRSSSSSPHSNIQSLITSDTTHVVENRATITTPTEATITTPTKASVNQPEELGSPIILDLSNLPMTLSSGSSLYQQAPPPPKKKIKNFVNDGPWSQEEHERFMEGYRACGQNWKAISENYVKSRTRVQVHAHALKVLKNVHQEGSFPSFHVK
ncbi:hypothetical protein C9374_001570 [Naegleria lovaniensis]|uniref:Uncharacterized protein n=1 Tax=Naegleria lovaniensis TaxID=51637 RepID=A0AA88GWY0_NAELO|nr:uncharacterized protein C9374_001570 [Naegleria lovaniensis]KAG2387238.1 hypothetical protein C9374_001570 [Naegleria lovaniensis]